jgi:hypothetical protein
MHLDEERLQRLLDTELIGEAESAARAHLISCATCQGEVAAAERERMELSRLLSELDHPAPPLTPADVMVRAGSPGLTWARRAAVVVLALGLAGVAYAAPGSPIPGWIRAITGRADRVVTPSPVQRDSLQTGEPVVSGIAVDPGPRLVIVFPSPPPGSRVRVSLSDTAEVVVRALTGRASFSSGDDRLVVETGDSAAAFQVVVPRSAPWIEIRADETSLFRKERARITSTADSVSEATWLLQLTPSRP